MERFGIEIMIVRTPILLGYERDKGWGFHKLQGTMAARGFYISPVIGKLFIGLGGGIED